MTERLTAEATGGPGSTVVLRLAGALDLGSTAVLHEALSRCLPGEPGLIVFDLSALTDAVDEAVATFDRLADQASAWPGTSVVLGAPLPAVAAMLTRTLRRVPVFGSVADALAWPVGIGSGPHRVTLDLGPEVSAAATARRLVDRAVDDWELTALRDPARLVMTELVSNAVRHAGTSLAISLALQQDAVHLSVRDHDTTMPTLRGPVAPTVEGGRGLLVVDLLSRAWGITPTPDGKVVWASLARP